MRGCLQQLTNATQEAAQLMFTATINTAITNQLDRIESNLPAIPARIMRLQRTVAGVTIDRTVSMVQAVAGSTKHVADATRVSGRTVSGQARAASEDVSKSARTGVNTVIGQARAATTGVVYSAAVGARTVRGQAAAQTRRVATTAQREVTGLLDSAIDTVEDDVDATLDGAERTASRTSRNTTSAKATRGRPTTKPARATKPAVKSAVKSAVGTAAVTLGADDAGSGPYESRTRVQLLERARELDLQGRNAMSKAELIEALRTS